MPASISTATGRPPALFEFPTSGARFSPCRTWRYLLWRQWNSEPICTWIMLNPSTADEVANDPTVERCERRARAWGFGGLRVVNLFALRSTDPAALRTHPDPIGPENDERLLGATVGAELVICAWGAGGALLHRATLVRAMLVACGVELFALKCNADGQPAHPLYLPYSLKPFPWRPI